MLGEVDRSILKLIGEPHPVNNTRRVKPRYSHYIGANVLQVKR